MSGRGVISKEYFNLIDNHGWWITKGVLGGSTAGNWWYGSLQYCLYIGMNQFGVVLERYSGAGGEA